MSFCGRAVAAVLLVGIAASGQTDARAIVERSVEAVTSDWDAAPGYECFETDRQPKGGSKTFEDLMILGSPYQRLVSVNGKPLPRHAEEEQRRQLQETIASRRNETQQQREQRIAKYGKSRERDHLFLMQMAKAFDFTLMGEQRLGDYDVYVLQALPRHDYQPPNTEASVLKGMRGTLWIDKNTYQWVKVEAHVTTPVWIEGFIAEVEPGTEFELDKMMVGDGVWLPQHYVMKARAKVFFLFNHNSGEDDTFFDYRKAEPDEENAESK